jgi:hypothetical protein
VPTERKIGGMPRLAGLVVVGVIWLASGDAMAAAPVAGGHYHFVRSLGGDRSTFKVDLELTLANDGRELAYPSGVSEQLACGRDDTLTDGIAFDGAVDAPFRALPIGPVGRFSAHGFFLTDTRRFHLTGTFTRGGRFAVGSLIVRGGKTSCPAVRLHFRAPLVGRPNRSRRDRRSLCDRVTIPRPALSGNYETYRVYDEGMGCTTAREIARQWRASRTCQRLAPGGQCNLDGATCQAVTGGQFNSLVSAHCTSEAHPGGVAELVHFQPCGPPKSSNGADVTMWAVNLDCATASAFPVDGLLGDPESGTGPCSAINNQSYKASACSSVGGYACRARSVQYDGGSGFYAVCVQQHDGFRGLVFYYEI